MSLQGLISGSECAVPSNPLSQVLKHTEGDRSLQQDRIAGPSSGRLHHLPGTVAGPVNQQDMAMARQFFEGNGQGSNMGPSFGMPHQLPGPADLARMGGRAGPDLNEAWAREQQFHQAVAQNQTHANWAADFGTQQQHPQPGASIQHDPISAQQELQQRPSFMPSGGMYNNPMQMGMYGMGGNNMFQGNQPTFDQGKGKGKLRDVDFEAAFAQVSASLGPQSATTSGIEEVKDGVTNVEELMKNATLDEAKVDGQGTDFNRVWDQLQNSDVAPPKEDLAKWEAEFNQVMGSQREDDLDYDFNGAMQDAFRAGESADHSSQPAFDEDGYPILSPYTFETNNKHMPYPSESTRSFLSDAKEVLSNSGSLSEAALLLEAAIQKGELGEGGYEAWILLGETRNMDEREELGMRALTEGVKRAEEAGAVGAGQMSLAISYTNESYERASYAMLLRWLMARHPSHPIAEGTVNSVKKHSTWDAHSRVTDAFLSLARMQHAEGILDPEVQIGLGVLFYTNSEFDRAKDCFGSALQARPDDYLLWNRYGSSLSNGSKPEEALGAYRNALNIHPTYTRAIYNVGVACLNIGAYKEAAEHFLSALNMQQTNSNEQGAKGDTGDQLWFTLRRALLSMDRSDLAAMTHTDNNRPSLDVFRKEGFDF
ncbi:TPR-like protein [Athelia psychrophila]|uniref:TPR-like protein n=1 Tax=Athelia psychrophila TaxID=1759441 RepID=A0A166GLI4_9AGAM|nr:TPR-like protein [Fibularhizoctonia sp. CBS 109695]